MRITFGCKKCEAKLKAYAAFSKRPEEESIGYMWYQDLPDKFQCDCGSAHIDLNIIRRNLFVLLGHQLLGDEEEISYTPLYERSSIETLLGDFKRVLDTATDEETLQRFIEDNPIVLHQFPAEKIFFKPPILTFFKADFAVVTPQGELILIEIEKATMRLLKTDGGEAAPLTHAFDQVQRWLYTIGEHRLAVLDSLKIDRGTVSSVRGVVIAGRDSGYDAEDMRRLKGVDRGRITFLTYDDLSSNLVTLIKKMTQIWN